MLHENVSILKSNDRKLVENTLINPTSTASEALKLLFNLMLVDSRYQDCNHKSAEYFKGCLVPIFYILFEVPLVEPQPMVPPHSQAVHALMQFTNEVITSTWKAQVEWLSRVCNTLEKESVLVSNTFITLLDKSIHALIPSGNPDSDLPSDHQHVDATLSPLLLVIRNLTEGNALLREKMSERMLPSEE